MTLNKKAVKVYYGLIIKCSKCGFRHEFPIAKYTRYNKNKLSKFVKKILCVNCKSKFNVTDTYIAFDR
jgi:hypothetical protein